MDKSRSLEHWEYHVQRVASALAYPPTPDLTQAVRGRLASQTQSTGQAKVNANPTHPNSHSTLRLRRYQPRLAWLAAALLIIAGGLTAVPPVQDRLLAMMGLGNSYASLNDPTPTLTLTTPTMTVTDRPAPTSMRLTATPQPASTPLSSVQAVAELPHLPSSLPAQPEINQAGFFPATYGHAATSASK